MNAVLSRVANRGTPPPAFIEELVAWGQLAPDEVFAVNKLIDIYSFVKPELGPFPSLLYRKAVMLEVLRVLAGFESSWNWNESKDKSNPAENTVEKMSAGPFQISADSLGNKSLAAFARSQLGTVTASEFRSAMMNNRMFAIGYTARLLRITTRHNGPVKRREINPWLRRDAVAEFLAMI